jgi:hypothetical protein
MAGHRFALMNLAVLLWLTATAGLSQQLPQNNAPNQDQASDPAWMDLESLLNTKVTTAAKFAEQISDAGGVMSVVSGMSCAGLAGSR